MSLQKNNRQHLYTICPFPSFMQRSLLKASVQVVLKL